VALPIPVEQPVINARVTETSFVDAGTVLPLSGFHNAVHRFDLYRSTGRASYDLDMTFVVHFDDDSSTLVQGADAYEQEGPLTTFFERNGGGRLASSFAVRVASFRTSRIVEVRRDAQSSVMSASSTTTSQRCAHSPHR
jgi:hypothetical protein